MKLFEHKIELEKAIIIKRPSATCKTPYVADIDLNETITMAHTPALGCCGLNDKGANVYVMKMLKPKKCSHSVELALTSDGVLVGTNPKLAETLVENSLNNNFITGLQNIKSYKREHSFKNSRFDFHGFDEDGKEFFMEVKSVPLAKNDKRVEKKMAYFPDGYRKSKKDTISPRALKHITELEEIKLENPDNVRCILCFVIQRDDVDGFMVSEDDPIYREAVMDAYINGVEVFALVISWNINGEASFVKMFSDFY
jgi:DNA-binding sugar fermentation-stimulating protein